MRMTSNLHGIASSRHEWCSRRNRVERSFIPRHDEHSCQHGGYPDDCGVSLGRWL